MDQTKEDNDPGKSHGLPEQQGDKAMRTKPCKNTAACDNLQKLQCLGLFKTVRVGSKVKCVNPAGADLRLGMTYKISQKYSYPMVSLQGSASKYCIDRFRNLKEN
jgi:hypothetical protein